MTPVSAPAPSRPAAVALLGIAKKFGQFVALRDIDLTVALGEFVCFLGPSGCGKTTLLRIIAGLERQNAGQVMMAGRDVSGLPPSLRNYGIVFQSYALFPNLTVARNGRCLAFGAVPFRMARSLSSESAAVVAQMPLKDPVASRSDFERHRLAALGRCPTRKLLVGSEQNVERVDDVCPGFLPRFALADRAGNLGYLRSQPAVASVLVANR